MSKLAALKAKSAQSMDRFNVSVALWTMAIKSEALYAMDVVPVTKDWVAKMDAIQNRVMKWVVKASVAKSPH